MRIAISGKSGCGNTTVSKLLGETLGYPVINFTFRQMAVERNMEFWSFCELAERDYSIDRELDRRQVEMAMSEKNCILGSRLAIWMLKEADLKVYLRVSEEVRAKRVCKREGGEFEKRLEETLRRDERDHNRYLEIYGLDNYSYEGVADLIIDGDDKSPSDIVSIIMERVNTLSTC